MAKYTKYDRSWHIVKDQAYVPEKRRKISNTVCGKCVLNTKLYGSPTDSDPRCALCKKA